MIIWGFGKVTKKMLGNVERRYCKYCETEGVWQLCVMRTWFTLFFIPLIPYATKYCIVCPTCGSYVQLTKEEYISLRNNR